MAKWIRQPQERKGKYMFNGALYITRTIQEKLTTAEIAEILQDVWQFVQQENGIDYLQVYINEETKEKIFFIDQLDVQMKEHHPPEHNYATLLFAWEY